MFDCLAMSYKDSDYTIVIADPNVQFWCWNLPLWWSYECFCFPIDCHCSSALLSIQWQ